tara:strand:+ start:381 stop:671 length:291 start_codon:yes stop_codon:yes gene_type:complete
MELKELKSKLEKEFGWKNLNSKEHGWFVDNLLKDTIQAINFTDSSLELKEKNTQTFEYWLKDNRYIKGDVYIYDKNGINYITSDLRNKYNKEIQTL